jgi:hypothetical protein
MTSPFLTVLIVMVAEDGRNDLVATELQEGKAIFVGYSVPCEDASARSHTAL